MTTFFTADSHFQHGNIIKYCLRPFRSASEMDDALFRNWAAVVQPGDTVYHLGDVVFDDAERALPRLRALPGKKYLVPGNHDTQGKLAILSEVFEILPALTEIALPVTRKGKYARLSLCHYPMESWNRSGSGGIMLHGHNHGRMPENAQRLDVGVDCWDFRPVSLQDVLKRLETLPKYESREKRGFQ